EVGHWLGWLGLGLTLATVGVRLRQQSRPLSPHVAGWIGLAVVGLLACTVESIGIGWSNRWLMVGCAGLALAWALGTVRLRRGAGWNDAAAVWVSLTASLAVLLGFKAAIVHHDHFWAAGAIALASPAVAVMAVRRRREEWAFAAG